MVPCVPSVTPLSVGQQRKNPDALIGRRGPRAETLQRMASPDTRITNPPNPTYSPNQRTYAGQRSNNRDEAVACDAVPIRAAVCGALTGSGANVTRWRF
jgi:hypothetical protein